MPDFDGLNIPATAWCSIPQAIRWIEDRQIPLDRFYESLLPGRGDRTYHSVNDSSKKRLILQAANGGVTFRGKPAKGKMEVVFDARQWPSHVRCSEWGNVETIPPDKVEEAGVTGLPDDNGELIGCDVPSGPPWAFSEVEVNFRQLMAWYPAPDEERIRIGGRPVPNHQPPQQLLALPPPLCQPYTTRLLAIVDALRPRIALDPERWTRAAIEEECRAQGTDLTAHDMLAIILVLLPDSCDEHERHGLRAGA
jgi:hypothetical protein